MHNRLPIVLVFFLLFSFLSLFASPVSALVDAELMQQGSVRTCLKAEFEAEGQTGTGPVQTKKIHLTGRCESPAGCACISSWGRNSNVVRLENESCDQQLETALSTLSEEEIAKKKAAGKCNPKETSKRTGKNCGDCSCLAENLAVSCGHAKADNNDPFLSSLQAGNRPCNIVSNQLIAQQKSTSQVLGAATGVLPYGDVDVIVEEETYKHTPHDFVAAGTLDGEVSGAEKPGANLENGSNNTIQNGTLIFADGSPDNKITNLETQCSSISWDPYGRVFDATTLEPISDVEVTMIDNATLLPALQQYNRVDDMTGEDGVFNIQVEKEGMYQLKVAPLSDHSFIPSVRIHPNWKYIYSDLYSPSTPYVEKKGIPTHHDIALHPNAQPYTFASAEPIDGSMKSQNMGKETIFMGRVTFPFAQVCLIDTTNNALIGECVNANNIGRFTIAVATADIPPVETTIQIRKRDLTKLTFNSNNEIVETLNERSSLSFVKTNTKNIFDPILSTVDGYVYNSQGTIIPYAGITVILSMNDSIFYKTAADANGYFSIETKKLPYVEYYFEYIDPITQHKILKKTAQFITENAEYLRKQQINPMHTSDNNPKHTTIRPPVQGAYPPETQQGGIPAIQPAYAIFFIIGILIILVLIGIAAYIRMRTSSLR